MDGKSFDLKLGRLMIARVIFPSMPEIETDGLAICIASSSPGAVM